MSTLFPFDFSDHRTPWARDTSFLQNIETDLPPDDLRGRFFVWAQQQNMDPLPKQEHSPSPPDSVSKDDYNFAGLQLNQDITGWKRLFVVESNGRTGDTEGWTHEGGRTGLAAGKLYIGGEQAETIDKIPFVCSGFCLEDRFFATTQHFLRLRPDDPAASAQGEHLAQLRDPNSADVKISTARKSKSMVNNGDTLKAAYLIYNDRELDIAIFRLKDPETSWEDQVKIGQLVPTELHRGKFIFTVGYATGCHTAEHMAQFLGYWDKIVNSPQSVNDEIAKEKLASIKDQGKPSHKKVFRPYERGIAFGHIRGETETEILDDVVPRTYHKFYRHSIPGWFGMSGSMICVIEKDLQIRVIGLFKGGEPKDNLNRLVPLSAKTIKAITEQVTRHPTPQANPSAPNPELI